MSGVSLCLCALVLAAPSTEEKQRVEVAVAAALHDLPGQKAFAFTELTDQGVTPLYAIHLNERLAVGSTFKLFILGRLIEEVNAGKRRLDNTMLLTPRWEGPPASEMAQWPAGSPVTLQTLALKMMWISDNTATDHLHYLLGREEIEQQMKAMGHGDPAVNIPLLNTREMTSLRDKKQGLPGKAYLKLSVEERREFLAKQFAGAPDYQQLDFDTAAYTVAEWYASPLDMAHALAWIKNHTPEDSLAAPIRQVIAVDPKLSFDKKTWPYVGFKGGSEDQLIAGNWLLKHRNGKWYTLHVYVNSPKDLVKPEAFLTADEKILKVIESALEK